MRVLVGLALLFTLQAPAWAAPESHCAEPEAVIFHCEIEEKQLSVCQFEDGQVSYRFGPLGEPEITIDSAANYSTRGYAGGGESRLRFTRGEYSYLVFDMIGNGEILDEETGLRAKIDIAGVRVVKGGKEIATLTCTDSFGEEAGAVLSHKLTAKQTEEFVDYD